MRPTNVASKRYLCLLVASTLLPLAACSQMFSQTAPDHRPGRPSEIEPRAGATAPESPGSPGLNIEILPDGKGGERSKKNDAPPSAKGVDATAAVKMPAPYFYANTDPEDDYLVAPPMPRGSCVAELNGAMVRFRSAKIPVHRQGKNKFECGAPEVVTYLRSKEGISYSAPPTVTCSVALALARFETIVQEEATRILRKRVRRIDHLGTYSCREMAAYPGWVSEHSYANAIDIEKFILEGGQEISILKYFEKTNTPPKRKEGEFLRSVSQRLYDEGVFSSVLTAHFDALHRNHFHLDLARYRTDGTRPCSLSGC